MSASRRSGSGARARRAAPREVIVSFGDATLLLDGPRRPAARTLGARGRSGDRDRTGRDGLRHEPRRNETLAIRDADMIEAIAAVSRAHRLAPPRAPRRAGAAFRRSLALSLAAAAHLARAGPDPRPGRAHGPARGGRGAAATRCCCSSWRSTARSAPSRPGGGRWRRWRAGSPTATTCAPAGARPRDDAGRPAAGADHRARPRHAGAGRGSGGDRGLDRRSRWRANRCGPGPSG